MRTCLTGKTLPGIMVYDRIAYVHVWCSWCVSTLWRSRRLIPWLRRVLMLLMLLKRVIRGILLLARRRLLIWRSG
jgi:hypothetical protein